MSRQTPEEIEREIEFERAELAVNLSQLQESLSLDGLMELGADYARTHGRDIGRTVLDTAKANPIPVALISAGLAWLAFGPSRSERQSRAGAAVRGDVSFPRPAYAPIDQTPEDTPRYRTVPADMAAARVAQREDPDWAKDDAEEQQPSWVPADDVWSQPGDRK